MGVGAESRAGLPRDGSGHRCIARGRDRPFATREGSAVGGGYGSALRDGGVEQLRVWRGGAVAPEIWRDGGTHQYGVSALVCGQLQSLQPQRGCTAGPPAQANRAHRAAVVVRRERGGRPLGRSVRRVPLGKARGSRLSASRDRGASGRRDAARERAGHGTDRVPYPAGRTRGHVLRLGPLPRVRGPAPQQVSRSREFFAASTTWTRFCARHSQEMLPIDVIYFSSVLTYARCESSWELTRSTEMPSHRAASSMLKKIFDFSPDFRR